MPYNIFLVCTVMFLKDKSDPAGSNSVKALTVKQLQEES